MRRALWDDCPGERQVREMEETLGSDTEEVFVAERPGGGPVRFPGGVPPVKGRWVTRRRSATSKVGTSMRMSVAREWDVNSVQPAEAWARSRGCRQMASDAELWNEESHGAHGSLGYKEAARLELFKKDLYP